LKELFVSARTGIDDGAAFACVNSLLTTHFPLESGFTVVPRPVPVHCVDDEFIFTLEFDVQYKGEPVLIALVKPEPSFQYSTSRMDADKQIRIRFGNRYKMCPSESLHGLVFFGSKVAHYTIHCESGNWSPPVPQRDPNVVNEKPPKSLYRDILGHDEAEWMLDVLGHVLRTSRESDGSWDLYQ